MLNWVRVSSVMDTSAGDAIGFKAGDTGGANIPTQGRFFVGGLDGGDGFIDEDSVNKKMEWSQFYERPMCVSGSIWKSYSI